MSSKLKIACTTALFCLIDFYSTTTIFASNSVVISQIQIGKTGQANFEFVEVYNPTENSINLKGWRLTKKTSTGTQSNLVASMSGTVQPYQYFLVAHPLYTNASSSADLLYSATSSGIANNNTVLLYSDAGQTLIDKVGFGNATDFEATAATNPEPDQALLRVGIDTDNNNHDFIITTPSARNSQYQTFISPTPTIIPSPTLPTTPIPTPSPEATPTPTSIPTPTITISPTPEPIAFITPFITPTPSPEPTPTSPPSHNPVETVNPSPSPEITPTPITVPTISPSIIAPNPTNTNEKPKIHPKFAFGLTQKILYLYRYLLRFLKISPFSQSFS